MKKNCFILSLLLIWFSQADGQGKWELKKNEDGIAVYTRKPAKGNVKELRVVCELEATKAQQHASEYRRLYQLGLFEQKVRNHKNSKPDEYNLLYAIAFTLAY